MAYSTASPPMLLAQTVGGTKRLWIYASTDAASVVRVAAYISDAKKLGMQAGDMVLSVDTDAAPITQQWMSVASINATTGSADLSDGLAVTATNTD